MNSQLFLILLLSNVITSVFPETQKWMLTNGAAISDENFRMENAAVFIKEDGGEEITFHLDKYNLQDLTYAEDCIKSDKSKQVNSASHSTLTLQTSRQEKQVPSFQPDSVAETPLQALLRILGCLKSQQPDARKRAVEELQMELQKPETAAVFQSFLHITPKSNQDVQLRNIALMINEAVHPNDTASRWRRILRDEKVMKKQSLMQNAQTLWFVLSNNIIEGNAFDDFNTALPGNVNLDLDDFVKFYGQPDIEIVSGDNTVWHMYGPVGVGTPEGSNKLTGKLRIAGFLWLALEKSITGKYPDHIDNPGVPDISSPFKQ